MKFNVTSPNGKRITIEGNKPPSEQELNQIFGSIPQSQPQNEKRSLDEFGQNIIASGGRFIGDTASAILNPVQTVKGIISLVKDPMVLVNYYKDRYGKDLAQTLYEDPVGVLADLSTLVGGAGAVLKGVDAVSDIGRLGKVADVVSDVGRAIDPLTIAGKGVQKIVSPVSTMAGKGTKKALLNIADRYTTAGLGSPKELGNIKALTGMSQTDFFNKYNLWDKTPETIQKAIDKVNDLRSANVHKSGLMARTGDVIMGFDDEISKLEKGVKGVISESDKIKIAQLKKLKDKFINSIGTEYSSAIKPGKRLVVGDGGILEFEKIPVDKYAQTKFISSMPIKTEASVLDAFRKKIIDPDIPKSTFGMSNRGSSKVSGSKIARETVRSAIEKVAPGTRKLGREESALIRLRDVISNLENRQSARQPINFTKLGTATAGGIIAGFPGAAAGFLLEKAINSPKGTSVISKTLQRAANASFTPDLSKFNKITPFYKAGKVGRMISPKTNQKQQSLQPIVSPQKSVSQPIITPKPITGEVKVKSTGFGGKNPFKRTKKVKKGSFV